MRILVFLCYRGYSIKGTFSAMNKTNSSTNFLQDILEKAIYRFCPARRPTILLSTHTECNVHSLCNAATIDFELPGKQKLGTGNFNIPWFKYNLNRILIETNRTLRILDARFVHDAFEPKLAAKQRTYLYRFHTDLSIDVIEHPLSTYISSPISILRLQQAISLIHNRLIDYQFYTSSEARLLLKTTQRIVSIQLIEFPNLFSSKSTSFALQLTTTNFLHQMIRRLTTDLIHISQNQLSFEEFQKRLQLINNTNERNLMVKNETNSLLNIHGLYLENVQYDEEDFQRYITFTTMKTKFYPLVPILTGEE